ncbi:MAG: hypothetical protein JWM81_625 [Candidatus Saccharibacteria bacterium]|nr:hypothetical protein [Candidatus Saccharibacteria bacterium]
MPSIATTFMAKPWGQAVQWLRTAWLKTPELYAPGWSGRNTAVHITPHFPHNSTLPVPTPIHLKLYATTAVKTLLIPTIHSANKDQNKLNILKIPLYRSHPS